MGKPPKPPHKPYVPVVWAGAARLAGTVRLTARAQKISEHPQVIEVLVNNIVIGTPRAN